MTWKNEKKSKALLVVFGIYLALLVWNRIDAMDAANEKGMAKTFNMIVLGGLLKLRPVVSIESVRKALRKTLPERHHHLIPMNEEAIRIGMEIIKPQ